MYEGVTIGIFIDWGGNWGTKNLAHLPQQQEKGIGGNKPQAARL